MSVPFKVDLNNKTAVVTGGGGILCSGFSEVLAECGAKVAVCDINLDAAEKVAAGIRDKGYIAKAYKTDVLSKESLCAVRDEIKKDFGVCDILLNGAGGNNPRGTTSKDQLEPEDLEEAKEGVKTFFDLDPQGIEFVFNLNFLGALIPTQVFAGDMANRDGAVIINISSMNAIRPLTRIPAYSGAKAAISNLTMWLAVHFAKVGIRCNAIAPGFFLTNQNHDLLINKDGSYTARSGKILAATPMERFGTPDELSGTLLYLVDKGASGFVNGVVIPVDGGFSAYSGV